MHFRHRQTARQTDTDIVAQARDVYITSRAKNRACWSWRYKDHMGTGCTVKCMVISLLTVCDHRF